MRHTPTFVPRSGSHAAASVRPLVTTATKGRRNTLTVEDLVRSFVDIVSKNGNLLLNIGPMADGTIPDIQRERLLGLGEWLDINGEAIFDTRPWVVADGTTDGGVAVRFTQKEGDLYATLFATPASHTFELKGLRCAEGTSVTLLGEPAPLTWRATDGGTAVTLAGEPARLRRHTPCASRRRRPIYLERNSP